MHRSPWCPPVASRKRDCLSLSQACAPPLRTAPQISLPGHHGHSAPAPAKDPPQAKRSRRSARSRPGEAAPRLPRHVPHFWPYSRGLPTVHTGQAAASVPGLKHVLFVPKVPCLSTWPRPSRQCPRGPWSAPFLRRHGIVTNHQGCHGPSLLPWSPRTQPLRGSCPQRPRAGGWGARR